MVATSEDARLLFARWKSESSSLRIKLMSHRMVLEARGTVLDFSPTMLQLGGENYQFTIPLGEAIFTFSDPREIPVAAVRNAETARYEFGLAVELPEGDRIALMELKSADSVDSDESAAAD